MNANEKALAVAATTGEGETENPSPEGKEVSMSSVPGTSDIEAVYAWIQACLDANATGDAHPVVPMPAWAVEADVDTNDGLFPYHVTWYGKRHEGSGVTARVRREVFIDDPLTTTHTSLQIEGATFEVFHDAADACTVDVPQDIAASFILALSVAGLELAHLMATEAQA